MAKRIVSGIFILTALGALGVILAGAMTSGEQLIVRFLTAVTVAALALYVVSDLRLQSEQAEPRPEPLEPDTRVPAPKTTTAVMATVTGSHRTGRRPEPAMEPTAPRPNHESPAPVTAAVRATGFDDPTESLTGSRLVPPLPELGPPDLGETTPPHRTAPKPTGTAPVEPEAPGAADPSLADLMNTVNSPTTGGSERPLDTLPPDDLTQPAPPPAEDSTIASTSFTYSGKLDSADVDWPPKRPTAADPGRPTTGDGSIVEDGGIDEPTAELPALEPTFDDPPLEPTFDDPAPLEPTFDDPAPEDEKRVPYLFAVDTLDSDETLDDAGPVPSLLDAEPADAESIDADEFLLDLRESGDGPDRDDQTAPERPSAPSAPLAPAVRASTPPDRLDSALRAGEIQVINSLISQGMLSTGGPITDRDVRTMVYVAFTSNELRKLILAGGTPDGIRAGDLDLGPVELFDESRYAPVPKLLYSGVGADSSNDVINAEPILDLTALDEPVDGTNGESAAPGGVGDDDDVETPELIPTLPAPRNLYRITEADVRVDQ